MERTITFIAEHKKREYEQVNGETKIENSSPQETQDEYCDPEFSTAE